MSDPVSLWRVWLPLLPPIAGSAQAPSPPCRRPVRTGHAEGPARLCLLICLTSLSYWMLVAERRCGDICFPHWHKLCGNSLPGKIMMSWFLFLFFLRNFIYYLAALGLCCCTRAFSSCSEQGLLFVAVRGLLIAVASLVEHRL